MDMYTLQYFKWITNRGPLYSTGNSAQCFVAAWMGGECRGETIHVYVHGWSIQCSPETIMILLISYILTENKV